MAGVNGMDFLDIFGIEILQNRHEPAGLDIRFHMETPDPADAEMIEAELPDDRAVARLQVSGNRQQLPAAGFRITETSLRPPAGN